MRKVNKQWLDHLTDSIQSSGEGNSLSMYSIALEGWRRGLTLKFFTGFNKEKFEIQYSLSDGIKERKFEVSRGDELTEGTIEICEKKSLTKDYLVKHDVLVPKGKCFNNAQKMDDVINFGVSLGFPLVLKPDDGKLGRGVILNIENKTDLKSAINYVRNDLGYSELIIEQYIDGIDYRIYILKDKILGAVYREPANVIGDGESSITNLIKLKNNQRKKNPNLSTRPIKMNEEMESYIKNNGYSLDTVLPVGQKVYFHKKGNISSGGDPIDVTNQVTSEMKETVLKAVNAIPGFTHGGIDIIVSNKDNRSYVLEFNTRAGIGSHLFPLEGEARDIPKELINFYFPESSTKLNINKEAAYLYFDFNKIMKVLRNNFASEIVVSPIVGKNIKIRTYEIYGDVHSTKFRNWIQQKILLFNLSGNMKYFKNGNAYIKIVGDEENLKKMHYLFVKNCALKTNTNNDGMNEGNISIKAGFEIIN